MNFAHQIHPKHAKSLSALYHPDNSTRVQTLCKEDDTLLHQMLLEFGSLTGYPILVNTSMNGAGEPIIETPKEALKFFITNDDVDALLINSWLVTRREPWQSEKLMQRKVRLADGCLVSLIFPNGVKTGLISFGGMSFDISETTLEVLCSLGKGRIIRDVLTHIDSNEISEELYGFLIRGIIILVKE